MNLKTCIGTILCSLQYTPNPFFFFSSSPPPSFFVLFHALSEKQKLVKSRRKKKGKKNNCIYIYIYPVFLRLGRVEIRRAVSVCVCKFRMCRG